MDSASFIDANRDFVLKLKIKSTDGNSQIRRVRLPRLVDSAGDISYDELIGLCVTFTFPEEAPENFEVSLTYFDVDEDTVTVASTDELLDAIEQFSHAKVLRLTTEVKPKKKQAPRENASPSGSRPSSATHEPVNINPQLKGALDTFVGVLSTAVRHLQEGLAAPLPEAQGARGVPTASTTRARPAAASVPTEAPRAENEPAPFVHGRHTCDSCRISPIVGRRFHAVNLPDFDLCEACHSSKPWDGVLFEEVELERDRIFQKDNSQKKEEPNKVPPHSCCPREAARTPNEAPTEEAPEFPFIHGRHTCDSCLTTPIIGKRFHAVNLPDYDLCEDCHSNYTGKEVRFEEAELDRDRAFQLRWQRRHEKVEKLRSKKFEKRVNENFHEKYRERMIQRRLEKFDEKCRQKFEKRFGAEGSEKAERRTEAMAAKRDKLAEKMKAKRAQVAERVAQKVAPSPPGRQSCRPHPAHPRHATSADRTGDFDDALKEAIRRSLRDIAPKEAELMEEQKPPPSSTVQEATSENIDNDDASSHEHDEEPSGVAEPSQEEVTSDKEEKSIIFFDHDLELEVEPESPADESFGPEDTKDMEEAMEVDSVDSEKLLAEDDRKPAAKQRKSTDLFQNESFQSDAAGSGDVAEAVGATLDLVAGMISDMLSESDKSNMKVATKEMKDNKTSQSVEGSTMASSEALIIQPVASVKSEAVTEDNEWQVVDGDEEGTELDRDEDIARAAEMLGSALFNSSTQDSGEHGSHGNVSNLSDSFSVPSTVPSINISASQRARWCEHLSTLRELGFCDETRNVDILERLQAANIGVDSDDDVSVTRVVNMILEQK